MAEISVIIPVHNTGKYLDRCLDSVLGQTLADIEVICVDDASDDGSAGILARRAEQDGRLKVLTQENNAGPGMARNRGIDCAGGRFIYFLDSDDWIESALLAEKAFSTETVPSLRLPLTSLSPSAMPRMPPAFVP